MFKKLYYSAAAALLALLLSFSPAVAQTPADYTLAGTLDMASATSAIVVDASKYTQFGIQVITSAATGSFKCLVSNNGTNFVTTSATQPHLPGSASPTDIAAGTAAYYTCDNPGYRYFRVAVNVTGTGTASLIINGKANPVGSGLLTSLVKSEDAASVAGDLIMPVACRANTAATSVTIGSDGDYGVPACTTTGAIQTVGIGQALGKATDRLEDDVYTSGDAMVVVGGVTVDGLPTSDPQSGAGDIANLVLDRPGRLYVNGFGNNLSSMASGCSGQNTGTSNAVVLAALASYRLHVTSYYCYNVSGTTDATVSLKDGTTTKLTDFVTKQTGPAPRISQVLPSPLRLATNTAFNMAPTVASAVECCAVGFYSAD